MLALLPVLSLLSAVRAQGRFDAGTNDIAVVQARFEGAQLVPQFLPTFSPEAVLEVSFGTSTLTTGETLAQSAVSSAPELRLITSSGASRFTDDSVYTVIMADADVPGTDFASTPQTRHWLVNTVSLPPDGQSPYLLDFTNSTAITDYAGPGPAEGSGPHRYVIMVYSQPGSFTPPADLSQAGTPLGTFQVQDYVSSTGLGALVAANYFTVENGQASASIPATTSVDPATVSAASTTAPSIITSGMSMTGGPASASMGGGASGGSGMSSAASGASSAASTNSPSAGNRVSVGKGMITGAVGVVGALLGAALAL